MMYDGLLKASTQFNWSPILELDGYGNNRAPEKGKSLLSCSPTNRLAVYYQFHAKHEVFKNGYMTTYPSA